MVPAVVDELNDHVVDDYMSGPFQFFLVHISGKIAFRTAQAPWSLHSQDVD